MMKRLLLVGLLAAAFAATGTAHADHGEIEANITVEGLLNHTGEFRELYNANTDTLPGLARALIADERINLHVAIDGENRTVGAVMDGVRIGSIEEGGLENATVELYTDEATIQEIATATNRGRATVRALNDGGIRYESRGLWNRVTFGVVSLLLKAFGGVL